MNATRCRDKYDKAVEYLTQHPNEIYKAWKYAANNVKGGVLFQFCTPSKQSCIDPVNNQDTGKKVIGSIVACGCLTQVRSTQDYLQWAVAHTKALTLKILADKRLPDDPTQITVEHLPLFAAWQRFMDKYFAAGCDDSLLVEEVMP